MSHQLLFFFFLNTLSFFVLFFSPWANHIQCIELFLFFSEPQRHFKQLCFPLLIPESRGRNLTPHLSCIHKTNKQKLLTGGNSHHSPLLGFCFNFCVVYVEHKPNRSCRKTVVSLWHFPLNNLLIQFRARFFWPGGGGSSKKSCCLLNYTQKKHKKEKDKKKEL